VFKYFILICRGYQ